MTTNAKKELLNIVSRLNLIIKCAYIPQDNGYMFDEEKAPLPIILKENYSEKDYDKFLNQLNFKYDSGCGSQELYGTVWLTDNSWLQRGEYDGYEWWEHMTLPTIPNECK